jgi:hypothetical protein
MTRHYTKRAKQNFVEQFLASDLTQMAFCQAHTLNLKTFNKWLMDSKSAPPVPVELSYEHGLRLSSSPASLIDDDCGDSSDQSPPMLPAFVPLRLEGDQVDDQEPLPIGKPIQPAGRHTKQVRNVESSPQNLCLKIHGFSLEISAACTSDFKSRQSNEALKCIIEILHKLPDRGLS